MPEGCAPRCGHCGVRCSVCRIPSGRWIGVPQDAHIDGGHRFGEHDVRTVGDREDEGIRARGHREPVKVVTPVDAGMKIVPLSSFTTYVNIG